MPSKKQKKASRKNIVAAQKRWQSMTHFHRALAQPQGRARLKPGSTGKGEFYHIVVRPKEEFTSFRNQDVGKKGHLERLAGRRSSGSWATQTWLIGKTDATVKNGKLIAKSPAAKKLFATLGSVPSWVKGDIFQAKDRRNIPEKDKPTLAQRRAQAKNIKKAQAARRRR
ncbi:MAG: hypothetical protein V1846_04295 [Candidatus Komeilibacteria bacterium]